MKQDLSLEALRKTKYQFEVLPKPLKKFPPPKMPGKTTIVMLFNIFN